MHLCISFRLKKIVTLHLSV